MQFVDLEDIVDVLDRRQPIGDAFSHDGNRAFEELSSFQFEAAGLYTRELIQNARDAVIKYLRLQNPHISFAELIGLAQDFPIQVRANSRYFEVGDMGIGMTPDDIQNFLLGMGVSSKSTSAVNLEEAAGRFGIGFISAFHEGTEYVEVDTAKDGQQTKVRIYPRGHRKGTIQYFPGTRKQGTNVRVVRRKSRHFRKYHIAKAELASVKEYCHPLDIPLWASGPGLIPWSRFNPLTRNAQIRIDHRMEIENALCTFALNSYGITGVLGLTPESLEQAEKRLEIVKSGMVAEKDGELLGDHFATGIVRYDRLNNVLSRGQVERDTAFDELYAAVQRAIPELYQQLMTQLGAGSFTKKDQARAEEILFHELAYPKHSAVNTRAGTFFDELHVLKTVSGRTLSFADVRNSVERDGEVFYIKSDEVDQNKHADKDPILIPYGAVFDALVSLVDKEQVKDATRIYRKQVEAPVYQSPEPVRRERRRRTFTDQERNSVGGVVDELKKPLYAGLADELHLTGEGAYQFYLGSHDTPGINHAEGTGVAYVDHGQQRIYVNMDHHTVQDALGKDIPAQTIPHHLLPTIARDVLSQTQAVATESNEVMMSGLLEAVTASAAQVVKSMEPQYRPRGDER